MINFPSRLRNHDHDKERALKHECTGYENCLRTALCMAGETTRTRTTSTPNPVRSVKICQLRLANITACQHNKIQGWWYQHSVASIVCWQAPCGGDCTASKPPGTPPSSDTNVGTALACQKRGLGEARRRRKQRRAKRDPKAKCFLCSPSYGMACRWAMLGWIKTLRTSRRGLGRWENGGKLRGSSRPGGWGRW